MWHKRINWSGNVTPPLKSGDTVEIGNMSQWKADTPVLQGMNNLTFINVNMQNIKGIDLSLVLRREGEWRIFEKNIRCKGCLIMQEDVSQKAPLTAEQEEAQRFEHAVENLFFDHGGEQTVIQKIADKYNLQPIVEII